MTTASKYKLLRERLEVAGNSGNKAHVMPKRGRWVIFKEGDEKVLGTFSRRNTALSKAMEIVESGNAKSVVLHKSNGMVEKILTTAN